MLYRESWSPRTLVYLLLIALAFYTFGYVVAAFIGTIVFGLFTYYVTRPVYRATNDKLGHPRVSATLAIIVFFLPLILIISYTGIVALHELRTLFGTDYLDQVDKLINDDLTATYVAEEAENILEDTENIGQIVGMISDYLSITANLFVNVFLVFVITYYALKDGKQARKEFERQLGDNDPLVTFLKEIDQDFEILFFGNILYAFFAGVIAAVTYFTLNLIAPIQTQVPYPFLLGVLTGVASLIPIIGVKMVYVPIFAHLSAHAYFAGAETYWFPIVFVIAAAVIIDTIPDFVIRPYVSGERLHMGTLIFAYVIGPMIFGWYGLFFGPILLIFVTNTYRTIFPSLVKTVRVRRMKKGDEVGLKRDDSELVEATVLSIDDDEVEVSVEADETGCRVVECVSVEDICIR